MNALEYNILFNPIIGENTIKDVEGTFICSPNISLFKFSTLTDFHLISSTKEYEVWNSIPW